MLYSTLNNISKKGLNIFTNNYELIEDSNKADLLLVRSFNMHEYEINENLLAVARAGAGVNNIPLEKMADEGVVVFNTPGANANGVKELVIAGMLLASRDILGGINWIKENKSDENLIKSIEKAKKAFAGNEIMGKTITVMGLGAIGGKVANACSDLGMKVYGYDPFISEKAASLLKKDIIIENDLDKLYPISDFVSIHIPLLDSTKDMFNDDVFTKLKDGVVLLNYSRDGLVKDDSLKKALETGKIKKYVTDFPNHFVANLENVIFIPHLGASTAESEENCAIMAVKQLIEYTENGNIINSVNYPNINLGNKITKHRLVILTKQTDSLVSDIDQCLNHLSTETKVSKFKKQYGIFAYDLNELPSEKTLQELKELNGVIKLRLI